MRLSLACCQALAKKGFQVLLGCRDLSVGQQIAAEQVRMGLDIEAVKLDVTSQIDIDLLAGLLKDHYQRIDLLINNAGILIDAVLGQPASIFNAYTPSPICISARAGFATHRFSNTDASPRQSRMV